MTTRIRYLFAAILSCTISPVVSAAGAAPSVQPTFYVSPGGKDSNPGTKIQPFATIEKAKQAVRKVSAKMTGDIVVELAGGTYLIDEPIVFDADDSGRDGHDVVYRAAADQMKTGTGTATNGGSGEAKAQAVAEPVPVFISGGKPITGWQPDADGRWKAKTGLENFRQLYVNGKRAIRARSGTLGENTDPSRWEFLHDPSRGGGLLEGSELIENEGYRTPAVEMADWRNQGDIEFCYTVVWAHTRCKVESIVREGDQAIVKMLQPYFLHARTKEGVQAAMPAYIENAFELLDEPGEWYFDRPSKTVYYMPREGEDMKKADVIAPAVETLLAVRGTLDRPAEHLRFEGITFRHGSWLLPSQIGLVDVQANFIVDSHRNDSFNRPGFSNVHNENLKSPANVVCRTAKSVVFSDCTFTQLGGAGLDIEFGSQDNEVVGCHFYDISGSAVQIGGVEKDDHHPDDPRKIVKNNSVVNCSIHDCCVEYMGGVGVCAGYTEGTRLAHNVITRLPYSGISMGWGWGEEDAGGGAYDTQAPFYDTPTPAKDNRIEFNHIHHVMQPLGDGGGVYMLGNQPGTIIRGNHIHNNPGAPGGIYLDEGSGFIEITGNLVYNVPNPMNYNNRNQNRIATCNEHDNYFGIKPTGAAVCPGISGNAMVCDGAGDCMEVAHDASLEPEQLALEAWIKLSDYPGGNDPRRWIVNKNTHEFTDAHYALAIDGKKPTAYLNIGGGEENFYEAQGPEALELNRWHQLAMTYDGAVLRTYLDGKEVASKKIGKQRTTGSTPLSIARRQDGYNYFQGEVDEARLYNRALSAAEVRANFKALTAEPGKQGKPVANGLVAAWSFDVLVEPSPEVQAIVEGAGLEKLYRDR